MGEMKEKHHAVVWQENFIQHIGETWKDFGLGKKLWRVPDDLPYDHVIGCDYDDTQQSCLKPVRT